MRLSCAVRKTTGNRPYRNRLAPLFKSESPPDLPEVIVTKPENEHFTDVDDYGSYRLIKKLVRYNDDVADGLSKMTRRTAVRMKDQTFNGRDSVSIIAIMQDSETGCDACNI